MSESENKKVQKSRHFRELFLEFLDVVREDVDDGESPFREFHGDPNSLDDDCTTDLESYFDRAGLEVESPGHWQFLLVALVNHVHREQRGNKAFPKNENNDFLRDIAALKKQHNVGRLKLCEMWVDNERAAGRYPGSSGTNRTRLQDSLTLLRAIKNAGKGTQEELEWLAIIDTPVKRGVGGG